MAITCGYFGGRLCAKSRVGKNESETKDFARHCLFKSRFSCCCSYYSACILLRALSRQIKLRQIAIITAKLIFIGVSGTT